MTAERIYKIARDCAESYPQFDRNIPELTQHIARCLTLTLMEYDQENIVVATTKLQTNKEHHEKSAR